MITSFHAILGPSTLDVIGEIGNRNTQMIEMVRDVLVPRVGVEPTRPYGQRILRTLQRVSRSLMKRYEPVFTRLAVVKVSLRLATYQHVRPPSWPHPF